jgi:DNA mismatch repair protein MutL
LDKSSGQNKVNKIHFLADELINQIAAGEVVERPASAVKELVENSLDAGATKIEIEIKEGGRKLIRVRDNGSGMSREDAQLAFSRHATSKISELDDLHQINSLGFRGEALPSIASVSKISLTTRSSDEQIGTQLRIEASQLLFVKDAPANPGTIIEVSDLFYSTPARRKFLKSQMTETRHILDLVTNFTLAFPPISFKLSLDNREVLNLSPGQNLGQRVKELFGKDTYEKLIELKYPESVIRISGFISQPELSKSSRSDIRFFVNRRSINNRALLHALTAAYGEMLTKGRFPLAIIFLEVPAELVDVNVHPQKLEVRFQDERAVHDLVFRAVKKTLDKEFAATLEKSVKNQASYPIIRPISTIRESAPEYQPSSTVQDLVLRQLFSAQPVETAPLTDASGGIKTLEANFYQLFNTYILTQSGQELLIVDQHAAHEKILYEQILKSLNSQSNVSSQKLLFPETLELSAPEFQELQNNSDLFDRLGFEIQTLGGRTIMVSALPALSKNRTSLLLKQVLDEILTQNQEKREQHQIIASALACRSAVKSGDVLTLAEMRALLKNLLSLDRPQVCPHGRPTLIRIPLSEIERRFGRS